MPTHNDFLSIMQERGFFHQCTDESGLKNLLNREMVTAYAGFDCTAASLHVGHLLPIMVLRWFQKCGHRPIALMGGGTTKVGDPSGRDETRKLLSEADISNNLISIQDTFKRFLDFGESKTACLMVNNAAWLDKLNYIEFLRDYGRHFSINRMLSMDSVKLRLEREQELTFLEFNYMILQAYDFVSLAENYHCRVQLGGSDQWGNIINGVELHRRLMAKKNEGKINEFDSLFGITTPLITTSSGAKMGKTASGAVWLNADMLPAYDYWQFWRNTEDGDVESFLKFFTELSLEEINKIMSDKSGAGINEAKKILANEATRLCHGEEAAQQAAETARKTFEEGGMGGDLPEITVNASEINKCGEGALLRTLLIKAGFAESNGEAKKLIMGGGIRLNDHVVSEVNRLLTLEDFVSVTAKLSKGKKHHARIVLV